LLSEKRQRRSRPRGAAGRKGKGAGEDCPTRPARKAAGAHCQKPGLPRRAKKKPAAKKKAAAKSGAKAPAETVAPRAAE